MRDRWAADISARAAAYWTPERKQAVLGDRKNLLVSPDEAAVLLRALGLLRTDGSMPPDAVRKFMQINHMVALLEPVVLDLVRTRPTVRVLDVACGSSYLTLLLAWCFEHRWHHPAQLLGLDRNDQVIGTCRQRAPLCGLDGLLRFETGPIGGLDVRAVWRRAFGGSPDDGDVHALLALHACDTATDEALALGVASGVDLIAAAPCCQADLSRRWTGLADAGARGAFVPVWSSPHLRREAAATMTDMLRTLLLRGCGYEVTPMEFVPAEHTPKNTLIRAVRRRSPGRPPSEGFDAYVALCGALGGVGICLEDLLPAEHRAELDEARRRVTTRSSD
jgi:SAM-dependent methyltransferase